MDVKLFYSLRVDRFRLGGSQSGSSLPSRSVSRDGGKANVSFDLLPWYFSLREEARKSWHYAISNKLVYSDKISKRHCKSFFSPSENDICTDVWIELHLVLKSERELHYTAILERFCHYVDGGIALEKPVSNNFVRHDVPMLVDIPQFVKSPQMGTLVSIPAIVRLQRLHDGDCCVGNPVSAFNNPELCIQRVLFANRETDVSGRSVGCQKGQLPRKMIKRGTQAGNEVPRNQCHSKLTGIGREIDPNDIPSILQIILRGESLGIRLLEQSKFSVERVKVFLRPLQLQVGIKKARHQPILAGPILDLKG